MSQKDFIKLEHDAFSKLGILDRVTILNVIINGGIARELRDYAESHNYEITEEELLKIIYNKVYN
ncbi:MAG: hypothetical protein ABID79_00910 [Elusimicrobiota bacterium]